MPAGPEAAAFARDLADRLERIGPGTMLTEGLRDAFRTSLAAIKQLGVECLTAAGIDDGPGFAQAPVAFRLAAEALAARPQVLEECFGPAVMLVEHASDEELLAALRGLAG